MSKLESSYSVTSNNKQSKNFHKEPVPKLVFNTNIQNEKLKDDDVNEIGTPTVQVIESKR